jgi:hypothetical protein
MRRCDLSLRTFAASGLQPLSIDFRYLTCIVIPASLQSKLASTTSSRMASMIFFSWEPWTILASNIFAECSEDFMEIRLMIQRSCCLRIKAEKLMQIGV